MSKVETMEAENDVYRTLLESTKAIPWKIDWASMTFSYIGPQIEPLLGWSQQSWISADDWAQRIHEEDRERVVSFCIAQSQSGIDHEADYRALTADGRYVWIRDVVHVQRNAAGETEALIGFMFDISERKKTEERLLALQKQLEEYSYKDGLTGINNRRMFDSVLEVEWASAQRTRRPLSLVMLDIDYFKQFNDHYGHIEGDDCLRLVAQTLAHAAVRPRDCVARFGGEEFALILPETDGESAKRIAERCRRLIGQLRIPHEQSRVAQLLTLSLGVGTIVPAAGDTPQAFLAGVDRLLYQAKREGRDRLLHGHCGGGETDACQA